MIKRTTFFYIGAFLLGIYVYYLCQWTPLFFIGIGLMLLLLFISFFFRKVAVYAILVLAFVLGAGRLYMAEVVDKERLSAFVNEYVHIEAKVTETPTPYASGTGVSFVAEATKVSFLDKTLYPDQKILFYYTGDKTVPKFGEVFSSVCLLSVPEGAQNAGDFDYRLYLESKGIFYTAAIEPDTVMLCGTYALSFPEKVHSLQKACGGFIDKALPGDYAGLFKAISLGDKQGISDELYYALQVCGLSHVIAVSGMHVSILLGSVYVLYSFIGKNKRKFLLLTAGIVLLFMLFVGFSPSVVRATVMAILSLLALLFKRKEDALTSLAIGAGLLSLYNPFSVFNVGFILSFSATLGILLFTKPLEKRLIALFSLQKKQGVLSKLAKTLIGLFTVTVGAQIFLLPLSTYIFGHISLWGFITNLLVAPLLPFLLLFGLAIGFFGLLHPVLGTTAAILAYPFGWLFLLIVRIFGKFSWGLISLTSGTPFTMYVYFLFVWALYMFLKGKRPKALLIAPSLLLVVFLVFRLYTAQLTLSFINVGQGDCAFLTLPKGETVLVDGGGLSEEYSTYDVGKEVVLPYLKKQGTKTITYMIATHGHTDHIDGLFSVLEEIPTKNLLVPTGFTETEAGASLVLLAEEKGAQVIYLQEEDRVALDNATELYVFMPEENNTMQAENDKGLVFDITYGNNKILFTGDIERAGESLLTKKVRATYDILKVAHHGSNSSSSEELIGVIKPQYAYIPCGENTFGHPAKEVLDTFYKHETVVYRGDIDKDVTFVMNQEKIISIRRGGQYED